MVIFPPETDKTLLIYGNGAAVVSRLEIEIFFDFEHLPLAVVVDVQTFYQISRDIFFVCSAEDVEHLVAYGAGRVRGPAYVERGEFCPVVLLYIKDLTRIEPTLHTVFATRRHQTLLSHRSQRVAPTPVNHVLSWNDFRHI